MNLQFRSIPINFGVIIGVLGSFVFFLGIVLLLPIPVSLWYQDGQVWSFLWSGLGSMLVGAAIWALFKPKAEIHTREALLIVSLSWLIISLVGALPFTLSGTLSSYTDAVFETMSGFTTTGASILGGTTAEGVSNPLIESVAKSILFWRSLTHWLGGMGIIVLTIAILPLLGVGGMQLFQAETPGPTTDKLTPRVQQTAKFLWFVYAGMTLIQFFLLWIHPSMDAFDAINHTFATMGTGGFSTKNISVEAFESIYVEIVISLFMFLAGANFALHFRLLRGEVKGVLEDRELRFYTIVVFIAILLITLSMWLQGAYSLGEALRYGSFQAISIVTTTGFSSHDYELWPYFAQFTLFILFFMGGCAGSTGGGVKMIRWLILLKSTTREIKQIVHPKAIIPIRIGNRAVDQNIQRGILGFFILYIFVFMLGVLALTVTGVDLLSSIGSSITALGNIGPGFGVFGPTENFAPMTLFGKWIMIVMMMIGRLELFTVIVLFAPSFWKQ